MMCYKGLLAAVFSLGVACATAQETTATSAVAGVTSESKSAILRFTFVDSTRGAAVVPSAILIDGKMIYNKVDDSGRVDVYTSEGMHHVLVKADGYKDLDSNQMAFTEDAPMNALHLDRLEVPEELREDNLAAKMQGDSTLLMGYVIDDEMNKPVPGADVELLEHNEKVKTDKNGFFALKVSLESGKTVTDDTMINKYDRRHFRVAKPGYGFEERRNVLVESGQPKIFQIKLIRGTGGNISDEDSERNNLQSWVFSGQFPEGNDGGTKQTQLRKEDPDTTSTK